MAHILTIVIFISTHHWSEFQSQDSHLDLFLSSKNKLSFLFVRLTDQLWHNSIKHLYSVLKLSHAWQKLTKLSFLMVTTNLHNLSLDFLWAVSQNQHYLQNESILWNRILHFWRIRQIPYHWKYFLLQSQ